MYNVKWIQERFYKTTELVNEITFAVVLIFHLKKKQVNTLVSSYMYAQSSVAKY